MRPLTQKEMEVASGGEGTIVITVPKRDAEQISDVTDWLRNQGILGISMSINDGGSGTLYVTPGQMSSSALDKVDEALGKVLSNNTDMDGDGDVDITDGSKYQAQFNEYMNGEASDLLSFYPTTVGTIGLLIDLVQGDVRKEGDFKPTPETNNNQ